MNSHVVNNRSKTNLERSKPAFPGARFDANGFCVAHPNTRLCRITDDGKFKIVRKTCQKCGSAALMTDPRNVKTNVHGYKSKPSKHREIQGLLTAGAGNRGSESQGAHHRSQSHKENAIIGVTSPPCSNNERHVKKSFRSSLKSSGDGDTTEKEQTAEAPHYQSDRHAKRLLRHQTSEGSEGSNDGSETKFGEPALVRCMGGELNKAVEGHKSARRPRTLSPSRKPFSMCSCTLSPSRKTGHELSTVKKGRQSENASYFRKVSEELSPAHVKKVISTKFLSKRSTGEVDPVVEETKKDVESKRYRVPFDEKGYCNIHNDVQLATVDKKGVWVVMLEACPQCSDASKPLRTRCSSLERKSGKVKRALKQLKNPEMSDEVENPMAIYSEKVKEAKAAAALTDTTADTVLVPAEPAGTKCVRKDSKITGISKKSSSIKSMQSLTSATANSPDSLGSMPSPAFSSPYFTGGVAGFPALPLVSGDELNASLADTIKHSNSIAASKRKSQSRSRSRVAEMSG